MKKLMALVSVVMVSSCVSISHASVPTVTVTATPLWTDSALSLNAGDIVSITATGRWAYYGYGAFFGPEGKVGVQAIDGFLAANEACLIAYVGADPYQGHWGDSNFFPQATGYWRIGSNSQFTCTSNGKLWLGINDDAWSKNTTDNFGALTAWVSVQAIPEPGVLSLVVLGMGVFYVHRRLRRKS